jgi:hypothetical protein
MRRAIATLMFLSLFSPARADEPTPRAEVRERTYNAGKVDQGTVVQHSFLVKNIGTAELSIDAKPG